MIGDTTGRTFTATVRVLYCEGECEGLGTAAIELVWWRMDHGRDVISAASVGNCLLMSSIWVDMSGRSHMLIEALPTRWTNEFAILFAKDAYESLLKTAARGENDEVNT